MPDDIGSFFNFHNPLFMFQWLNNDKRKKGRRRKEFNQWNNSIWNLMSLTRRAFGLRTAARFRPLSNWRLCNKTNQHLVFIANKPRLNLDRKLKEKKRPKESWLSWRDNASIETKKKTLINSFDSLICLIIYLQFSFNKPSTLKKAQKTEINFQPKKQ